MSFQTRGVQLADPALPVIIRSVLIFPRRFGFGKSRLSLAQAALFDYTRPYDAWPKRYPTRGTTSRLQERHPWITAKGQLAVLSPDSDGFLSALFLCHHLDWKVVGFYDGKVLLLQKAFSANDCVFLDMEIYQGDVRSIGQHMLLYNRNDIPANWDRLNNCIQPNNLRSYDVLHDFPSKYPFATIHFLLGIAGSQMSIPVPTSAFAPLFFTDGAWQNLLRYPENCLNWLSWLGTGNPASVLHTLFHSRDLSLHESMRLMYDFYHERDAISVTNERGDRLRISTNDGAPFNLMEMGKECAIKPEAKERAERFTRLCGTLTGWDYDHREWTCWEGLSLYRFTKKMNNHLSGTVFKKILRQCVISFAVTAGHQIEYTLPHPHRFP